MENRCRSPYGKSKVKSHQESILANAGKQAGFPEGIQANPLHESQLMGRYGTIKAIK
jgi:hypothetical protein